MGFSPLANMARRIPHGGRQSPRGGAIRGVIWHYNYGVNSYGEATNPRRVVSANYWIANDGTIIPQIDENFRAWTSGAAGYPQGATADHYNITLEISNRPGFLTSTPQGAISEAALQAASKLTGDIFYRYRLGAPVRNRTPKGVGVKYHNDFVATSCPGAWIAAHTPRMLAIADTYRRQLGGSAILRPPTPQQKERGFLMALTDAEQKKLFSRIQNIQDILTGYAPNKYVQQGMDFKKVAKQSATNTMRVRDIKDYVSGGGPRGNDDTRLTEILAKLEGIEQRLTKIEGK